MNKTLFGISFFVNLIFSMLTTLLSLIVFNINHSTEDINIIMFVFISSLLITRIILFNNFFSFKTEIVVGCFLFLLACLILYINSTNIVLMVIGAILFGLSIGMIPPAILSMLSSTNNKDKNIGVYNIIVALASVTSPLLGEILYEYNVRILFFVWLVLSSIMVFLSVNLKEKCLDDKKEPSDSTLYHLKRVIINRSFQIYFVTLLFSSITYGTIVSYLPIYFQEINLSIGIYYLYFWLGYILIQFYKKINFKFVHILFALVLVSVGQLFLMLLSSAIVLYFSALLYGIGYGSLFKIFYIGIASFTNLREKNIAFSIIGLISYLGVGIAPVFLIPFNTNNWFILFGGNLLYSLVSLILFIILWRVILNETHK